MYKLFNNQTDIACDIFLTVSESMAPPKTNKNQHQAGTLKYFQQEYGLLVQEILNENKLREI